MDPALRLRITEPQAAAAELAKVYDHALANQPGFPTRNDAWWDRVLFDPEEDRGGSSPLRCVLAEDDSGPRGYTLYKGKGGWDDDSFLPDSLLDVHELVATDPAAGAALWHDVLGRDLVTEVTARLRPVDDPVLFQLLDPRRARPVVHDALWVRIIDLPAALSRRAYSCPVDVVLEVTDELLPDNAGRWRLRAGGPDGGRPLRADRRARRRRAGRPGTRRRLPRRHQAGHARGGGSRHPVPARQHRAAVRRHVLGSGPVVPAYLLTSTGGAH